jgi:hypothetical protein
LHPNAIHTPAAVPLAPVTIRSTKFPAATATLPVAIQADPKVTEQAIAVSAIVVGVPCRNVTVIVFDCCENTLKFVAVQPAGTHVNTDTASVGLVFPEFSE